MVLNGNHNYPLVVSMVGQLSEAPMTELELLKQIHIDLVWLLAALFSIIGILIVKSFFDGMGR